MKQWYRSTVIIAAILTVVGEALAEPGDWRATLSRICVRLAPALIVIARTGGKVPHGNS